MFTTRASISMAVLALMVCGCGGQKFVPVKGVVNLDGQPLARATVVFIALDPDGRDANGFTDAEGKFELSTVNPRDGALAGEYKIVIQPSSAARSSTEAASPDSAQNLERVSSNDSNASTLPAIYTDAAMTILRQKVPAAGLVKIELESAKR